MSGWGDMFLDIYKKPIRRLICNRFGLDSWHYEGIEGKEYVQITVRKVNRIIRHKSSISDGLIVEVGCGLGDIIGNIEVKGIKRVGYDINKRMICAAKLLNWMKRDNVKYVCGSFRSIKGKKIECLIIVNWPHIIPQDEFEKEIAYVMKHNYIKWMVVDEVRNDTSKYKYEHNYDRLLETYGLKRQYNGKRIKAAGKAYRNIVAYKKC